MARATLCILILSGAALSQGWPLPPVRTGNLFISGFSSHNVGEFAPDGTLLRSFTHPTMIHPRGVAVDEDGNVIVVVQSNSRILRLDPNGNLLQTITHPDLTSGTGIGRSPGGDWYVGSFNPGRIVVFDASWSHVTTITEPGMNGVNCVSFDSSGNGTFAATAAVSGRVYRFDGAHTLLGDVTHPNFASPMSIADDQAGNHYVSNGSSSWVVKFDAAWNPLMSFGQGTLSQPQGIAVDESGTLTISNFSASTVHRYDVAGTLLSSFPLTGVVTGRNMAWQTSDRILSRAGSVGRGAGPIAHDVLAVSGQFGDGARRITLATTDTLTATLTAPAGGPTSAAFALWIVTGEPTVGDATLLPLDLGLMAFAPPAFGGAALTLANSLGFPAILGTALLPVGPAPATVLALPNGLGVPGTFTLQGLIEDGQSASPLGWSVTNAVVVDVN